MRVGVFYEYCGLGPRSGADEVLARFIGSGQLLHHTPLGVYCCDRDGRVVQFNEHAAELWGCRPQVGETLYGAASKLFSLDGEPLS